MKFIIDGMGGDNAPNEIVKGALLALNLEKDISLVITGDSEKINNILTEQQADMSRIEVVHAPLIIENTESPTVAVRNKPESSLVKAFEMLKKKDDIEGVIGAGSTGAMLTAAYLKLGRIEGISRPAMSVMLPTRGGGRVLLLDCGANMDSKPINLLHWALMGVEYMHIFDNQSPRVGLLNVGTEEGKGNELTKETFELFKNANFNFVGNIEARDALDNKTDILVCDGFAGNVLLKSTEGCAKFVLKELKRSIKSSIWSKIGALFMKKTFREMKATMDYSKYGGSAFLGVKKIVIKSHGDSNAQTICNCIMQAYALGQKKIIQTIGEQVFNENE